MEIIEFVFSNFWIWLGTFFILELVVNGLIYMARAILRIPEIKLSEEERNEIVESVVEKLKDAIK